MSSMDKLQDDPRVKKAKNLMVSYPDFPKPGIIFRDMFPILHDPAAFSDLMDVFAEQIKSKCSNVDIIIGLESRGFLLGAVIAQKLELPFVPVRKAGKLPGEKYSVSFDLEYGKDSFEIQKSAVSAGQKIVIIDDLLATGGTMSAACQLVGLAKAEILHCFVIVELDELDGRKKISAPISSVIHF